MGVNAAVDSEGGGYQPTVLPVAGSYLKGNLSSSPPWLHRDMELHLKMWEGCFLNSWQTFLSGRKYFNLEK